MLFRSSAGFPPLNTSEAFRSEVRAARRRMERDRAFQMRLGRLYAIYEYRGLILVLTVAAVWWFASR